MNIGERRQKDRDLGPFKGLARFGLIAFLVLSFPLQAGEPVDKFKAQNMRELEIKIEMTARIIKAIGLRDFIEDSAIAQISRGLETLLKAEPDMVYAIAMSIDGDSWAYVDLDEKRDVKLKNRLTDEMAEWAKTLTEPATKRTTYKGISVIESVIPIEVVVLGKTIDAPREQTYFYIRLGFRVP